MYKPTIRLCEPEMKTRDNITVLIADRDDNILHTMCQTIENDGYTAISLANTGNVLRLARQVRPDVIVVDIGLPEINGFDLCKRMRALPFVNDTPILFTGTEENAEYVAQALDCGGDDYLCKPFAMSELSARVRALVRRTTRRRFQSMATLRLSADDHCVTIDGHRVALTPTEFKLLEYLCSDPTGYHTASDLLETIWQYPPGEGDAALVRNHIRNLRRKIEDDPDYPSILVSLHGRGYTINAHVMNGK